MTPLVSEAELLQAVAGVLQRGSVADLEDFWRERAGAAVQAATQEVYGRLTARGYSAAQVAAWDRGKEYGRHLGLYFALLDGAGQMNLLPEQIRLYDRRKELDGVPVTVGGAVVSPAGGGGAAGGLGVAGGRLSEAGYRFTSATEF